MSSSPDRRGARLRCAPQGGLERAGDAVPEVEAERFGFFNQRAARLRAGGRT